MLLQVLQSWLTENRHNFNRLGIAFSGGRDSSALLHALATFKHEYQLDLFAIHAHHGLMKEANEWVHFCQSQCLKRNIPLEVVYLNLQPDNGESIEALAREARYKAFNKLLLKGDCLLTAHHYDDQAETFLIQLARGSGVKGLSGIAEQKSCGLGTIARPLLKCPRTAIEEYCIEQEISWVDDGSNSNIQYNRNFIRHALLPQFQIIQPDIIACINRSVTNIKKTKQLLNFYIEGDLKDCLDQDQNALIIACLVEKSSLQQAEIVRLWITKQNKRVPNSRKMMQLLKQMLNASADKTPMIEFDDICVRRHQGKLYITSANHKAVSNLQWALTTTLELKNGLKLVAQKVKGKGISANKIDNTMEIRFRQGGETCQIANEKFTRKLKKVLQAAKIPHWVKKEMPLLYFNDQLVSVPGLLIVEGWQVTSPDEDGWVIAFTNH